jgi:hypothetical protein
VNAPHNLPLGFHCGRQKEKRLSHEQHVDTTVGQAVNVDAVVMQFFFYFQ